MTVTAVDVASRALSRLGEPAITSFDEDSPAARRIRPLYEPAVLDLLSRYEWPWARRRELLAEDAAANPVNEFTRAFLMPMIGTDRVGEPLSVFPDADRSSRPTFDYRVQDRWILTDHEVIVVEYIHRVEEAMWPGYFLRLVIEVLAAEFALPVTENASRDEYHRRVAFGAITGDGQGGLFGRAMRAAARGEPTRGLLDDSDPMQEVRFGGYRRWAGSA